MYSQGGPLLESPMMTAMHGKSRVLSAISVELKCLQYLFAIINKISDSFPIWRWSSNHRVVQAEGSSPREDVYQIFVCNDFHFSFMLVI